MFTFFFITTFFISCNEKVDLLIYNAKIYTVDSVFSIAEAIAVKNGKIVAVGTTKELTGRFDAKEKINAQGKFIYPGFIDAHAHFFGYGQSLQRADLIDTKGWDEVVQRVQQFSQQKNIRNGQWITGRGWDQNDWEVKEFPNKQKLDELFPNNPVLLIRVDGHAAIANQKALDIAGVHANFKLTGGEVEVKDGKLTGILIDNAVGLVSSKMPPMDVKQTTASLLEAQRNCFSVGLTTIDDCGINFNQALLIDSLQKRDELKMRIYAMLSDAKDNYDFLFSRGKIKTDHLNVRSFKVYADGALGSRGACLLQPYSDKPGWYGFLLSPASHFDSVANIISSKGFQMCTHAIGDSGNRVILETYGK
ncbi:MAG: amidohydrolase family protein, partial [Chitinophagaceae bacterium]|nr:amidohydrolase family protein [Chitinophagaceae bacterium]